MADFNYEITQELGVISETSRGWLMKLNMVSWNGKEPKYDIRTWSPDGEKMGKGVSLSGEEMEQLIVLWNARDDEDSFE